MFYKSQLFTLLCLLMLLISACSKQTDLPSVSPLLPTLAPEVQTAAEATVTPKVIQASEYEQLGPIPTGSWIIEPDAVGSWTIDLGNAIYPTELASPTGQHFEFSVYNIKPMSQQAILGVLSYDWEEVTVAVPPMEQLSVEAYWDSLLVATPYVFDGGPDSGQIVVKVTQQTSIDTSHPQIMSPQPIPGEVFFHLETGNDTDFTCNSSECDLQMRFYDDQVLLCSNLSVFCLRPDQVRYLNQQGELIGTGDQLLITTPSR